MLDIGRLIWRRESSAQEAPVAATHLTVEPVAAVPAAPELKHRPRRLRAVLVPWIVERWLPDFIERSDDLWHLSDDLATDMREWCIDQGIKPAPVKEFLSVLVQHKKWVKKERPWRLNQYEHAYALQRLKALGKRLDSRPNVYFFYETARTVGAVKPQDGFERISVEPGQPEIHPKSAGNTPKREKRAA